MTKKKGCFFSPYLLFLLLSGNVTLFNLPVAEQVPKVAKDDEDNVADVCEDGHQHGRLLKRLCERTTVQAVMLGCRLCRQKNMTYTLLIISLMHITHTFNYNLTKMLFHFLVRVEK